MSHYFNVIRGAGSMVSSYITASLDTEETRE
jgi:hypothetical protein